MSLGKTVVSATFLELSSTGDRTAAIKSVAVIFLIYQQNVINKKEDMW